MNYYGQQQSKTDMAKFTKAAFLVLCAQVLYNNADAATYDITPNPITTSAGFSAGPVNGNFTDTFNFSVIPNNGGAASITNVGFWENGLITNMSATIDGTINLVLQQTSITGGAILNVLSDSFGSLSAGPHTLLVSGDAFNASYGGNITLTPITATPLPGAFWMFGIGSIVMGWLNREKKR